MERLQLGVSLWYDNRQGSACKRDLHTIDTGGYCPLIRHIRGREGHTPRVRTWMLTWANDQFRDRCAGRFCARSKYAAKRISTSAVTPKHRDFPPTFSWKLLPPTFSPARATADRPALASIHWQFPSPDDTAPMRSSRSIMLASWSVDRATPTCRPEDTASSI